MKTNKLTNSKSAMTAVILDSLLGHSDINALNTASLIWFDEIFKLLEQIEAIGDNELKQFWVKIPRGSLVDYGFEDENEALEYFNVSGKSELQATFESNYPEPFYWYKICAVKYKSNRVLRINRFTINLQPNIKKETSELLTFDCSELLSWVVDAIKDVIYKCKLGVYNDYIQAELPYTKRYGVTSRKILWDLCPEYRKSELKDLTKEEIEYFIEVISSEEKIPSERIKDMTFNKYFEFAALSFKNARLKVEGDTLLEQFVMHGEDFGVWNFKGIDLDSPDDFYKFLKERPSRGGHPWGLRRGTSRSRIMLHPRVDENGYYFTYSGNPNWNVYEMVKMYLPLKEAGLPVVFLCPEDTIDYLREQDKIGFVPDDELTVYQQSEFKERIDDFYHYDPKAHEAIKGLIEWYPEKLVKLKHRFNE